MSKHLKYSPATSTTGTSSTESTHPAQLTSEKPVLSGTSQEKSTQPYPLPNWKPYSLVKNPHAVLERAKEYLHGHPAKRKVKVNGIDLAIQFAAVSCGYTKQELSTLNQALRLEVTLDYQSYPAWLEARGISLTYNQGQQARLYLLTHMASYYGRKPSASGHRPTSSKPIHTPQRLSKSSTTQSDCSNK